MDTKIHKLGTWEYWYDRSQQGWVAADYDLNHQNIPCQLAGSIFAYTKAEIERDIVDQTRFRADARAQELAELKEPFDPTIYKYPMIVEESEEK